MEVTLTDRAREYIVDHGGNVYVWVDERGLLHAKAGLVSNTDAWTSIRSETVRVFVSPAESARKWHIGMTYFPWKRLDVSSELTQNADSGYLTH